MGLADDLAAIRRVDQRQRDLAELAACRLCDAAGWLYDRRGNTTTKRCNHHHQPRS